MRIGLEILAFPCNQFLGQEPGNNEEIQQTVCTRFKAEFPIFDKVVHFSFYYTSLFHWLNVLLVTDLYNIKDM